MEYLNQHFTKGDTQMAYENVLKSLLLRKVQIKIIPFRLKFKRLTRPSVEKHAEQLNILAIVCKR